MHLSASLRAAALLLLAAVTATAQLHGGNPFKEQQEVFQNQRDQFFQEQERQFQLWEDQAVTPEQKLEIAEARRVMQYNEQQEDLNQRTQQLNERFQQQQLKETEEKEKEEAESERIRANLAKRQAHSGSGDILDAILVNGTLASLSDENIALFLANEASVNSVTGCFAGRETCFSEGAERLVNELLALQPGTLCLECQPGEEERLNEVIYQMVSGLSTRYPAQWSVIFPQIFSTIAAFQAKLSAQHQ